MLLLAAGACSPQPRGADPVRVKTTAVGEDTRVELIAAPGIKLNARLKPALELSSGQIVRFDSARLTPDSAYFAEPPTVLLPGRHSRVRGTLHASICDADEFVCRSIVLKL